MKNLENGITFFLIRDYIDEICWEKVTDPLHVFGSLYKSQIKLFMRHIVKINLVL